MHVTTIGYYWFAFAWLPNVLVAYVLYELFHDIQYYAITWLTCRHRVRRSGVASWLANMFRPGWVAAAAFVAVMTAFGALDAFGRSALEQDEQGHQVWLGLFLTAALLHYYYDGFIWKARESSLGEDLGIKGGLRATVVPTVRHAALWGLFFVPLIAILALGHGEPGPKERADALVAMVPGDFLSQAELGFELAQERNLPAAIDHYRASIEANPAFAQARANFGAALDLSGDLDGAIEQYEAALACRDHGGAHGRTHINLGVLMLERGRYAEAEKHFKTGLELGGEHPIQRMMALAAALPTNAADRRVSLYTGVLRLDQSHLDARYNLGLLLNALGRFEEASRALSFVVQAAPNVTAGRVALAAAQLELGRLDEARENIDRVLTLEPRNREALALRSRLGGR